MSTTPETIAAGPPRIFRRIVLGTAFVIALTIALAPRTPAVHAQESRPPVPPAAPAAPTPPAPPKAPAPPVFSATVKNAGGATATIDVRTDDNGKKTVTKTITIEKSDPGKDSADVIDDTDPDTGKSTAEVPPGRHRKHVAVSIFGDDREYDSFSDFVHTEPGVAGMVIMVVAIVFLTPLLAIALILWYRMRKARMLNETMLKLAEKGIVPPAEAIQSLAGAPSAGAAFNAGSAAPLYEQATQIRRRAAWSDLRKGVIMGGIGLGLTFFSMLDDGTPNSVGLVLLFVGIGYLVLWWFEERQLAPKGMGAGASPPAPPSGGTGGSA
jgi:hypothetical protein